MRPRKAHSLIPYLTTEHEPCGVCTGHLSYWCWQMQARRKAPAAQTLAPASSGIMLYCLSSFTLLCSSPVSFYLNVNFELFQSHSKGQRVMSQPPQCSQHRLPNAVDGILPRALCGRRCASYIVFLIGAVFLHVNDTLFTLYFYCIC